MSQDQLQRLLLAARQAVKAGEARRALMLLEAALRLEPRSPLVHFTLGQAHAALGVAAAAAAAFRQCAEFTACAPPSTQLHALHQTATDNLLLQSEAVLPHSWIAWLHDEPRLAALQAGIAAAVQQAAQRGGSGGCGHLPSCVLVCGGLGIEAVFAAQAGAQHVALLCKDNPLASHLAAQLAADSGCADQVTTATSTDQLGAGPQPSSYSLVILADALGSSIDWSLLQHQLSAVAPLLVPCGDSGTKACYSCAPIVLPHAVRICGQLVESAEAVALNEVDVTQMAVDTSGLNLSAANQLLLRARRSLQLAAYQHSPLSSPATLLAVPLASLLPWAVKGSSPAASLEASVSLAVATAGSADALCWWLEQQLTADGIEGSDERQEATWLSSASNSCPAAESVLHPHIWQHLEYLDRRPLVAGQAVDVHCWLDGSGSQSAAAADAATNCLRALSLKGSPGSDAGGKSATQPCFSVHLQGGSGGAGGSTADRELLLPVTAEQSVVAAAVPQYHTSMLNDSGRTVAYRKGIAAAMHEADAKAAAAAAAATVDGTAGQPQASLPLVLEIGSGSGLLLLLARQAGARHIIGCERLPELQQVAARLLQANGAAHSVTVLPKHSRELTVAGAGSGTGSDGTEHGNGADLPRRADVLLHEIFGTDPFSEGVIPSLVHARQHLLAPGAVLAPCKLHVVAAVAASSSHARLLRPPPAVCGGTVRTGALRQLTPRKVDCQVGKAGGLFLLTEPATILTVDFAVDEMPLADSATALLECLPHPVSMAAWVAAQRRQGGATGVSTAGTQGAACSWESGDGGNVQALQGSSTQLFVVSWFDYEFPSGVLGSSAPHSQRSEHWQQVVQPLEGPVAEAALAALLDRDGGSDSDSSIGSRLGSNSHSGSAAAAPALLLMAGYRVDRMWFELAGIAAAAESEEEEGGLSDEDG